jgi:hypothetical protein
MIYRVDATDQGPHGNIKVVATCEFEANTIADAEMIADDWAKGQRIFGASSLRIVRNEVILSQRMSEVARWSRSGVRPRYSDRYGQQLKPLLRHASSGRKRP